MMGSHEQEHPKTGWETRLNNMLAGVRGIEIQGEDSSIIINAYKDSYCDYAVEVTYANSSSVKEERYEFKKQQGLVYQRVTFVSSPVPNIIDWNFNEGYGGIEDREETARALEDNPARQVEFYMKANVVVDYIERIIKSANMIVRDPRPVHKLGGTT